MDAAHDADDDDVEAWLPESRRSLRHRRRRLWRHGHQDVGRNFRGSLTSHAGASDPLGVPVIGASFGALAVAASGCGLLPTTRLAAADVAAVGVVSVATGAHEEDAGAATTTKLKTASNWTRAEVGATLTRLFCVLLTQATALRPPVPAGGLFSSPS